ncbi:MAG: hypothetical protein DSY46_00210 [Hydrogenimonas sp.]|nr:MAG: hypothetical protein DSY46_00210 [Hydrogenimonas sp.]
MDRNKNLERARHHIVFLLALVFGSFLIYFLNDLDLRKKGLGIITLENRMAPDINFTASTLTEKERAYAQTAWQYFVNNYHEETGLVNSVDNYPSTTLWDTGNYLMALISAYKLGIIDEATYDHRLRRLLKTLQQIKLYKDMLPNKVYNAQTLEMTDYQNNVTPEGIGWSAIDIGRLLIPLSYIHFHQPQYTEAIEAILSRWDASEMTKEGSLFGAIVEDGKEKLLQEGRLGYEQYTSKMFATFGVDITNALRYDKYLEFVDIYDIPVPYDKRDKAHSDANNYVLMEPYMLDGLEFGWDYFSKEFSYRLYAVQKERYDETGILTAVTEDHLDRPPYFIYNCIYVNKKKWVAIDETGEIHNDMKLLSTKAAFAMDALYHTDYTERLIKKVDPLRNERGWYAGLYEATEEPNKAVTCNTNAIILESLLYKTHGPILKMIKDN